MPELPEVETVRCGLQPVLENAVIKEAVINRPNLRFPFPENFAGRLTGRRVTFMGRRAKYLVAELDSREALIMHLGMSGSFRIELEDGISMPGTFYQPRSEAKAHDHVVFEMEGEFGSAHILYNDPRRFGFMDLVPTAELASCKHFSQHENDPFLVISAKYKLKSHTHKIEYIPIHQGF